MHSRIQVGVNNFSDLRYSPGLHGVKTNQWEKSMAVSRVLQIYLGCSAAKWRLGVLRYGLWWNFEHNGSSTCDEKACLDPWVTECVGHMLPLDFRSRISCCLSQVQVGRMECWSYPSYWFWSFDACSPFDTGGGKYFLRLSWAKTSHVNSPKEI